MNQILTVLGLVVSSYLIISILKPSSLPEIFISFFLVTSALIIAWGYLISSFSGLGDIVFWRNFSLIGSAILLVPFIFKLRGLKLLTPQVNTIRKNATLFVTDEFLKSSNFEKSAITLLTLTAIFVAFYNLFFLLVVPPHEWDSMTYHLPRMAYYFQQGNLEFFGANYWAQVVHPKNSTLILIFFYIVTGRQENLLQLPQYFSYLILAVCVFAIARKIGMTSLQSFFAGLICALVIDTVAQSTTTQNDLYLTTCLAGAAYFLFAFRETKTRKHLFLASIGISLAIGTKASSLIALPAFALICLQVLHTNGTLKTWLQNALILCSFMVFSFSVYVLPSGYIQNYIYHGNPLGNQDTSGIHTFSGSSLEFKLQNGFYNLLRYSLDATSFSGLPPHKIVMQAQRGIQFIPRELLTHYGINLESKEGTIFSWFEYGRSPQLMFWGVFGFGLIWFIVLLSLLRIIKRPYFFILSLASLLYWVGIAFSGPYGAVHGRFFLPCTVFLIPLAGICLESKLKIQKIYILVVIIIGCISAISASIIKSTPLASSFPQYLEKKTIFEMNRLEQISFNYQKYYRPTAAFEHIVPSDASVAVFLYQNSFEYLLYGKYLTREIMPINSFHSGLQDIPTEAQFLLYAKGYPCAMPGDVHLGADWFLRKLNDENRNCDVLE